MAQIWLVCSGLIDAAAWDMFPISAKVMAPFSDRVGATGRAPSITRLGFKGLTRPHHLEELLKPIWEAIRCDYRPGHRAKMAPSVLASGRPADMRDKPCAVDIRVEEHK
ncbi:hypothetical protein FZEAL_7823 [Fusarium zealandicum]|uniref:Uncharacterized protein n=1 Tax=Fusarium zealandicum TaxID=1053134 RepID=A0A8H4UFA9_9HYPO|nr:hypothetical protein FZEAL_7823 [Fusarium zealandicum]